MSIVFLILFLCLFVYTAILLVLALGYHKLKPTSFDEYKTLPVTIIVCARNEEKNIINCLRSILHQDYDLSNLQLIFVNDASTDETLKISQQILSASGCDYKVIDNPTRLGKKRNITAAIELSTHEIIITRDADTTTASKLWLKSISTFFAAHKPDLVIAPVALTNSSGILWAIQVIENNVLFVLSAGSAYFKKPFLNNGANMSFTKSVFQKVDGFKSHMQVASGDDILFLETIKKTNNSSIQYLKCPEAIVQTHAVPSIKALFRQKIRWAAKFKHNKNPLNFILAAVTFLVNAGLIFCLAYIFTENNFVTQCLMFIIIKLMIDFLLLFLASSFLKNKNLYVYILPIAVLYPFYACITSIGAIFMKPDWK